MSVVILVVDDERDVSDLFRQQFRRELRTGHFVMEFACSAKEALRRPPPPEGADIVLILSDINMPGMSGLEMLPIARTSRPDVPVIMVTAYGDPATRDRVLADGGAGLLTKPIDFGALRSEIERCLVAIGCDS